MLHALTTGVAQPVPVDVASIDRGALGRVTTRGAPTARTTLYVQTPDPHMRRRWIFARGVDVCVFLGFRDY